MAFSPPLHSPPTQFAPLIPSMEAMETEEMAAPHACSISPILVLEEYGSELSEALAELTKAYPSKLLDGASMEQEDTTAERWHVRYMVHHLSYLVEASQPWISVRLVNDTELRPGQLRVRSEGSESLGNSVRARVIISYSRKIEGEEQPGKRACAVNTDQVKPSEDWGACWEYWPRGMQTRIFLEFPSPKKHSLNL
jgi:hypothetical protein